MAITDKALAGKVALVTGASRGIGRGIAVALGRRGAKVVINYAAREDAARKLPSAVIRTAFAMQSLASRAHALDAAGLPQGRF